MDRLPLITERPDDVGSRPAPAGPAVGAADAVSGPPDTRPIPETVIERRGPWATFRPRELWNYRDLLLLLAWRDVSVRYKQTLLGVAWAAVRPLLLMVVFVLFVGPRLGADADAAVPYALFAYSGLLLWTMFASVLSGAADSVVGSERLITKVYFPRLIIPVAAAAPAVIDFGVGGVLFGAMLAWYGVTPGVTLPLAVLPVGVGLLLAAAVGALLAALNVVYRDIRFAIPFFVQAGLFATPAIYLPDAPKAPDANAGESARPAAPIRKDVTLKDVAVAANPMNAVIAFFRAAVTGGALPWGAFGRACVVTAVAVPVCVAVFRAVESSFADLI